MAELPVVKTFYSGYDGTTTNGELWHFAGQNVLRNRVDNVLQVRLRRSGLTL
jgi:hypothetical protein